MQRFCMIFLDIQCKNLEKYSYNVCIFKGAVLYSHCHQECARGKLYDRTATCLSKVLTLVDGTSNNSVPACVRDVFFSL